MTFLRLITVLVLLMIAVDDIRTRRVHWVALIMMVITLAVPSYLSMSKYSFYGHVLYNLSFLTAQLVIVFLLFMAKERRFFDPIDTYIGKGDLLFFACLAFAFSPINFLLFYLTGLALCIPAYFLLVKLRPGTERSVPTAGFLALYLGCWISMEVVGVLDPFYLGSDNLLIQW